MASAALSRTGWPVERRMRTESDRAAGVEREADAGSAGEAAAARLLGVAPIVAEMGRRAWRGTRRGMPADIVLGTAARPGLARRETARRRRGGRGSGGRRGRRGLLRRLCRFRLRGFLGRLWRNRLIGNAPRLVADDRRRLRHGVHDRRRSCGVENFGRLLLDARKGDASSAAVAVMSTGEAASGAAGSAAMIAAGSGEGVWSGASGGLSSTPRSA